MYSDEERRIVMQAFELAGELVAMEKAEGEKAKLTQEYQEKQQQIKDLLMYFFDNEKQQELER